MKKALLPLLLVISLAACNNTQYTPVSNLKAVTSGHFSEAQLNYLRSENYADTTPYNGNMSVSKPEPVHITWEAGEGDYQVYVNWEKDNNIPIIYNVSEKEFDFYNPLFATQYTVTVKYYDSVVPVIFTESPTVSGPRNIYVDGVENFRDIGGYGKLVNNLYRTHIKQGMLYRSGRFNEDKEETVKPSISSEGLFEVNNSLRIKTEIDLRRTSNNEVGGLTNKSVLGDNVNYIQLPMAYGGQNILTFTGKLSGDDYEYNNPGQIKEFFKILADENNYPIDFHCSIGKDRTGCLAYLVEGLLGFDQETMYRDYMFTNFADAGMCKLTDITDRYGKTLDEYPNGDTLQEKIYNYLNQEIGVSKEYLDSVINILKA